MSPDAAFPQRLQLQISGAVQGVGFRPFVYHLARTLGLTGWIRNTNRGVSIELEGTATKLQEFQTRLQIEKPTHAQLDRIEVTWAAVLGDLDFTILDSDESSSQPKSAVILPDLATCPACFADIFTPANRHYRYPFTNCTHCGPRFSIVKSLPYDRVNTTLQGFPMCPACQAEYDNPADRRFHAQPNACHICGPHLELWDCSGEVIATHDDALLQAAAAVRSGQILAFKGLGGFQLIVDARNDVAVKRLRDRKHRPDKPLAVMFPSIDRVHEYCQVNPLAADLLQSANAPIVLLPVRERSLFTLSASIAPRNPYLGVMLPYTPLHHLLLAELGFPVVATSGNRSGEPICIDETQALQTLAGIADVFLVHNRPIVRPVDDSIVQIINGQPSLLRRARGYAPMPISLGDGETTSDETILAVGGHLKNTVALYVNRQLFTSQYIGDLDCVPTCDRFRSTIQELCSLYNTTPSIVVCDAHPDYHSTQFAQTLAATPTPRLISVQHHYAHVLSCLADNQWKPPVLGVAWDGTGSGLDSTIWGGEFLWLPAESLPEPGFIRAAHLRPFPLPGSDRAMREPRRCALGMLYECLGETAFDSARRTLRERSDLAPVKSFLPAELPILKTMLQRGLNTPRTSSVGRLFDAIASLLGLCQNITFEGQAAMQLEYAIDGCTTDAIYPYLIHDRPLQFDYVPMVRAILQDLDDRVSPAIISATFHNTLVAGLIDITCRLRNQYPEMKKVVLTGGCFQNRYLLERSSEQLQRHDFLVGYHHQLPSNDGGIAVGQIMAALRLLKYESSSMKIHLNS
ncbi:carbamoyltransferase HypF [Chamaesiphon sp. OTE_75_metabat_556]|uniref:carbamoyltransferase HypF n=1 Tax=Chamaesiphon sp. OTE_75_metabat_556 TaxID=2964692 RepID=UPI00286A6E71|nr:carbamoyltransferase HypF [Chamaesiphon sp. OTE_75_metabat_556]